MIDVNSAGINKLAEDIGFCFVVPIIFLCMGFANSRLPWNRRDSAFRMRLVLSLAILFLTFGLCTIMVQDRPILINLWKWNPVLYSIVFLIGGALVLVGIGALVYWKLRPELWRRNHHEYDIAESSTHDGRNRI
jgi:amino acid transporter